MPLSTDERSAINRENARHSTGPRSADGKARSRQNALKHGLRAAGHTALPNEDPAAVTQRADEWESYYRPQSPAARHLLDQCVRATLMADRLDRYHSAELAKQVRAALAEWDQSGAGDLTDGGRPRESDRAEAADRALVLHDPDSARLFLRYHAEARSSFHRAYKALVQTLDRDRAGFDDDVSPNEPNVVTATGLSPNEPNAAGAGVSPNEPNAAAPVISPNEPNAARTTASATTRVDMTPEERSAVIRRKHEHLNALRANPWRTPAALLAALEDLEAELDEADRVA